MENVFKNSLVDTQDALITTLFKKIAVIRETNCSEPKNIGKMELFLTELFTQTFVRTDTKQLKKHWSKY